MDNRARYRVPDELRETLLDFTIAYLLERPPNLVDFGIQFFQRLKREREAGGSGAGGRGSQGSTVNGRNEIDNDEGNNKIDPTTNSQPSNSKSHKKHGGGGGKGDPGELVLEEADATWIWHLAAKYILEKPEDIADWGLQYCLNEKGRWAYV